MTADKDDEFLMWVANRLVNRYGENPHIVNRIICIIAKNRLIRTSYKEGNQHTVLSIANTIKYLEDLQNTIRTQHASLISDINKETEETKKKTKIDFDNIDMESMLRGI